MFPFFAMGQLNAERISCVKGMFKYEIKKPSSVLKQVNELVKYLQP